MDDIAIKVIGLSKKYELGKIDGSISNAEKLRHLFKQKKTKTERKEAKEFYALKDLDFEIKKGEAVGIIGRNGAGKSTLLKILSGITEPSSGRGELNGSVASVLEVGTGFHPELTGRENIYLSGAMLGIPKKQIESKFDEIVEFAGVQMFIDTPVKHYSSGMYVRLAFSVVTNVDADILLFDEVLSVGDLAFQMKSSKKIKELVEKKKTVLLVSHNIEKIKSLCDRFIVLKNAELFDNETVNCYQSYLEDTFKDITFRQNDQNTYNINSKYEYNGDLFFNTNDLVGNRVIRVKSIFIQNMSVPEKRISINHSFSINIIYEVLNDFLNYDIGIFISNLNHVFLASKINYPQKCLAIKAKGTYHIRAVFPKFFFSDSFLSIGIVVEDENGDSKIYENILGFSIHANDLHSDNSNYTGPLKMDLNWEIEEIING